MSSIVLEQQQKLYQEKVLPNLSHNIKCGNSLIGTDILEQEDLEYDELVGLNPFDWEREFPLIFSNGGFNAVIGNPPYVFGGNKGITKLEKKYLKNKYQSGSGKINLFTLFMEKGVNILKESGLLSFIIPNTLLRVTSYKNIRKFLVDNVTINEITDLSSGIFKGVTTSSIIFTFSNNPSKLNNFVSIKKDLSNNLYNQVKQKDFTNHGFIYNIFCKPHERIIINKLKENSISLGEISKYLRFGVVISKNKDELISFNKIDDQYKPFLEGKEIDRYSIDYKGRYIKYVPKLIHRPRTVDLFESEKIMIQRISGGNKPIKSAYDDGYFYNKESIINFVIKSDKFYIKYVLALLNSNLINWYYSKEFSNESKLTVNLSKEYLSDIPIKNISLDEQIMFVELVDKIIDIKNRIKSCKTPQEDKLLNVQLTKIDEQINIKIYELYDLNNEEINIIENSFTK